MMRVFRDMFASNAALGQVLIVFGLVSIIVGALGAIGQSDIKRMLAFSSVSQIGYIMVGLGSGNVIGYVGAVMHFFNHATFKSLLFTDAAAILHQTGTRDMDKMGGLAQRMPVTGTSSIIALLSMAGIPPLSGFWSKLLVIIAVWQVNTPLAVAALLASAFTMGYFMVIQQKVFFGKPAPGMEEVTEDRSLTFVQVLLSALNVCMGVVFPLLLVYLHGVGLI
jgi:multicomponent Na+:H+ antiporter subunit D